MDNRKGKSIFFFVSLLPYNNIHILDPVSHLVIYSITVAVFQPVVTSSLSYLELPQSMYFRTKMPILLGWPGPFCNMSWPFYYFLNDLILPVILNAVYGCVVLIIIYWFSSLSATHKFSKNDLCLCFNSRVKMLNNAESNVDPWGAS